MRPEKEERRSTRAVSPPRGRNSHGLPLNVAPLRHWWRVIRPESPSSPLAARGGQAAPGDSRPPLLSEGPETGSILNVAPLRHWWRVIRPESPSSPLAARGGQAAPGDSRPPLLSEGPETESLYSIVACALGQGRRRATSPPPGSTMASSRTGALAAGRLPEEAMSEGAGFRPRRSPREQAAERV